MMEHDVPANPFVRALFYLRLTFIGGGRASIFLRHDQEVLERHFASVGTQNLATRSWNLLTDLYYKAGDIPWILSALDAETCFLGRQLSTMFISRSISCR